MPPSHSGSSLLSSGSFHREAEARILAYLGRSWSQFTREMRQDVVQETFLRFVRCERARAIRNPMGFMLTIAKHVACDTLRVPDRPLSDELAEDVPYHHEDDEVTTVLLLIANWLNAERPEDLPLLLLRLRRVGHAEIARDLGISHEAVRKRTSRLYEAIRRRFEGTEVDDLLESWSRR
jgi:DNA-directed RNA polymerase specialized sigma24 family protein